MYVFLHVLITMSIVNCPLTIVAMRTSANNENNRIDPIVRNLQRLVDTALQQDTSDDINNELLIEQLSRILEQEEGFRIVDRKQRSIYPMGDDERRIFDGSGDIIDRTESPSLYTNMSLITFTMGSTATALTAYTPQSYPTCQCEKGEPGDKGDLGICPIDCGWKHETYTKDCLGSRMNLERLAQSISQLILDTKKIAYRNAQGMSHASPTSLPTTTMSSLSNPFTLDYTTYIRLKGDKGDRGDTGTSCSPACMQSTQTNVRVFTTLQDALRASPTYPDHTYVHVVDDYGQLRGVYIRVQGQLIPLRLENENAFAAQGPTTSSTTLAISTSRCKITLSCPTLHMFALGPHIRRLCNSKRGTAMCSKLSDYDDLCRDVANQHQVKGFYRAFMSASTQWLSNLFAGICVNAKIVNMNEQTLFDAFEDIFEQKPPQSEIVDVQRATPGFLYWWHGTSVDGTASRDTCHDWSRQDSSLSGMVSRIPDRLNGLFHHQQTWPCSAGDSNTGILCIETNCDRNNNYKN